MAHGLLYFQIESAFDLSPLTHNGNAGLFASSPERVKGVVINLIAFHSTTRR